MSAGLWKRCVTGGRALRGLHTSAAVCVRGGRRVSDEDEHARMVMRHARRHSLTSEQVQELATADLDDRMILENMSSGVEAEMQKQMSRDTHRWKKVIERKYFSDVHKITPGERYSRKRDPYFRANPHSDHKEHPMHDPNFRPKFKNFDKTKGKAVHEPFDPKNPFAPTNSRRSSPGLGGEGLVSVPTTADPRSPPESRPEKDEGQEVDPLRPASQRLPTYAGPNLLLWSMKQQLRDLHAGDPERWDPLALAQSFPVSPKRAKGIIDSKWRPRTPKEQEEHDMAALENWSRLTGGSVSSRAQLKGLLGVRHKEETLPVATDPELERFMKEDVKFDTEKPSVYGAPGLRKQAEEAKKKKRPRFGYFSEILTNYEEDLGRVNNGISISLQDGMVTAGEPVAIRGEAENPTNRAGAIKLAGAPHRSVVNIAEELIQTQIKRKSKKDRRNLSHEEFMRNMEAKTKKEM